MKLKEITEQIKLQKQLVEEKLKLNTAPSDKGNHMNAVRLLFSSFPEIREVTEERMSVYLMVFAPYSKTLVESVVFDFCSGRIEGHRGEFIPTPAAMGKVLSSRGSEARSMLRYDRIGLRRLQLQYLNHDDCTLSEKEKHTKMCELDREWDAGGGSAIAAKQLSDAIPTNLIQQQGAA